MARGRLLGGRFELLDRLAGGGMGEVWRAHDAHTGGLVAVKRMLPDAGVQLRRFAQEARLLARVHHPAIVRYVTHGDAEDGEPYLVMEWLEGRDLSRRLRHRPPTPQESLVIARRVAAGLSVLHERRIVHRDLKPANVFLVDDDPAQAKIVDFGIARPEQQATAHTRTGTTIGTVGYMAPEQARGEPGADASIDVFALGCILFECLTGRPAFHGPNAVAVLAKVLMEEVPPLSTVRSDLPAELSVVLGQMMAKDPAERLADGRAVAAALEAMDVSSRASGATAPPPRAVVDGSAELRLITVVLASPPADEADQALEPEIDRRIHAIAREHAAQLVTLAGGALLATFSGQAAPTDQVEQAASCALALEEMLPRWRVALTTGRAETTGPVPVGPAIDAAARLVEGRARAGVVLDSLTVSLMDERYAIDTSEGQPLLTSMGEPVSDPRPVLGKRTACIGRDKELLLLEATFSECVKDSVANCMLVTGDPGIGKSRLRRELSSRLATRPEDHALLTARASPISRSSPLGLVVQLLESDVGLDRSTSPARRRTMLDDHLRGRLESDALVEVLRDLAGAPPDQPSPRLRAAREDPGLMRSLVGSALDAWVEAACRRPLVIVLEDVHWADAASLRFVERALDRLEERPLFVLALGRPELHERFPRLFEQNRPQEIRLSGLRRRAAARLVREVLEDPDEDLVRRIVRRGDGNPFYLEELIRCVAQGMEAEFPDTLVAVAHARFERLDPEQRRILRAASVFGESFDDEAVAAVLGSHRDHASQLDALVDAELLVASPAGQRSFRHALLREAAYATLTDADRQQAHRLAARWLEGRELRDELVVAEHYELGGEPHRAAPLLVRAAMTAAGAGDAQGSAELADRAIAGGAEGELLGQAHSLKAAGAFLRNDPEEMLRLGAAGLDAVPEGSAGWSLAAMITFGAATMLGRTSEAMDVLRRLVTLSVDPTPTSMYGQLITRVIQAFCHIGQWELSAALLERFERVAHDVDDPDPAFAGWTELVRFSRAYYRDDDPAEALSRARRASPLIQEAGEPLAITSCQQWLGAACREAGLLEESRRLLVEQLEEVTPSLGPQFQHQARLYLGRTELLRGDWARASALVAPVLETPDLTLQTAARRCLAEGLCAEGRLPEALAEARRAFEASTGLALPAAETGGALARVLVLVERYEEALDVVATAEDARRRGGAFFSHGTTLELARVEALRGLGRAADARHLLQRAVARVERAAEGFDDEGTRRSFLAMPDHQRLRDMAAT